MKISGYARKTVVYAAGDLFNKILLILFLPIFTRFLLPEEFAVYTNLMIFFSFASMIYLLGFQQSIFTFFYHERNDRYQFSLITSVYTILILLGLVLSTLIVIFRNELALLSLRSSTHQYLFIILAVILFFNTIYGITLSFLHIMEKSGSYALLSALQNVIVLILIAIFSLNKQFTVDHYFIFLAFASIIAALVGIFKIFRLLKKMHIPQAEKRYFNPETVSAMLKFGIVIIPGTIAMLILQASDRYMLMYLSANTLYDVGIYAAGYRIGMIMQFMVTLISLVYIPYAMRIAKEPQAQAVNRNMFKYYIIFGSFFGALIILYSQEIFRLIIDSNYLVSYKIVFAGVISTFLYGIFNIININYYANKKAGNISMAVLLGSILNIILNFILIPTYGIYGAGIASIIAHLFIVLFNYFVAVHIYKIKYPVVLIFFGLVILIIASLINAYIKFNWTSIIYKTVVFLGIGGIVFWQMKKNKKIQNLICNLKHKE